MATLEQRKDKQGNITYRAKIRLKGYPKTVSATFKRKTEARVWISETESEMRSGRYFKTIESKRHTLADVIDRYKKEILPSLKDTSHREQHLNWWKDELGHKLLSDLTPSVITETKSTLKNTPSDQGRHKGKKRTDATVNRYVASLSPVLTAAVKEWEWIDSNPCEKVKRGKESRGRVRFLSGDERTALLNACDEINDLPEMEAIILIAITTGARRGEILNLKWKDVDFNKGRLIIVDSKNGESRSIPLVGPAKNAMQEWSKIRPINEQAQVFPLRSIKAKKKQLDIDRAWRKIILKAELVDFRFHDLRHTAASYLAMNGAGLREIADILGHRTLAMVQRYSHLCDDHKHATVERMTKAIFK